ncbi:thioesterase [Cytobacillus sp. Sa5YUA1]|uniref:Thioesterase n=1 Tax=Cytobacillus stercorigallinarum TaxID=2762240 RepID=A0ABR8QWC7_9BACI|nr:thioesterase [Cytobacillus stercorigallinarum]MBD7939532.1 thioesterase [Cytobacillus stercorigallinarum]
MKDGLHMGLSEVMTIEVTKDMFAQFDGEVVHPVYSTASMVYHMEWVSRKILLPFLEDHEEGMGAAVHMQHVAPSGENSKVTLIATVTAVTERTLVTEVTVTNESGLIGKGEVKQAVLPKEVIAKKVLATNN